MVRVKDMFYSDDLNIEIINIFLINREKCEFRTPKRPFHILTKRISGNTDMFFGSRSFRLGEKQLFYIPANIEYSRKSYGSEKIIAIHFNITNRIFNAPEVISVNPQKIDRAFLKMYKIWSRKKSGYRYKCTSVLYKLLSEITVPKKRTNTYIALEKSIDYINENLGAKITVGQLADVCSISENYYRRLFKAEFGVSPVEYINSKRIAAAKEMLTSGYYSVSEIAYECGFSEIRYFNAVFKNHTGMSPTQYRQAQLVSAVGSCKNE